MAVQIPTTATPRLLGIAKVEARIDKHRSTIWRMVRDGAFPPPVYIGTRRAWKLQDLERWEANLGHTPRAA